MGEMYYVVLSYGRLHATSPERDEGKSRNKPSRSRHPAVGGRGWQAHRDVWDLSQWTGCAGYLRRARPPDGTRYVRRRGVVRLHSEREVDSPLRHGRDHWHPPEGETDPRRLQATGSVVVRRGRVSRPRLTGDPVGATLTIESHDNRRISDIAWELVSTMHTGTLARDAVEEKCDARPVFRRLPRRPDLRS